MPSTSLATRNIDIDTHRSQTSAMATESEQLGKFHYQIGEEGQGCQLSVSVVGRWAVGRWELESSINFGNMN